MKHTMTVLILCTMAVFLNFLMGEIIFVLRVFLTLLGVLVVISFLIWMPLDPVKFRQHCWITLGGLAIVGFMAIHPYELELRYRVSRSDLESLATRMKAGERFHFPVKAAAFTIRDGGVKDNGSVFLWTRPDPAGHEGFVFAASTLGYNSWCKVRLADECFYIIED